MSIEPTEVMEFDIFGHKVRFTPQGNEIVNAQEVVALLNKEASEISSNGYQGDGRTALLVALKLANDKLQLEKDYQKSLEELQSSIGDAMKFIDKFTVLTDSTVNQ